MSAELKRYNISACFDGDGNPYAFEVGNDSGFYVRYSDISDYIRDAMRYRIRRREFAYNLGETPEQYDAETDALGKLSAMERSK